MADHYASLNDYYAVVPREHDLAEAAEAALRQLQEMVVLHKSRASKEQRVGRGWGGGVMGRGGGAGGGGARVGRGWGRGRVGVYVDNVRSTSGRGARMARAAYLIGRRHGAAACRRSPTNRRAFPYLPTNFWPRWPSCSTASTSSPCSWRR